MSPFAWAGVAVLGGAGAVLRFLVAEAVDHRRGELPAGVLVVNLTGALLLGVLAGAGLHGDEFVLAGTATLGAYTTFSAWMVDVRQLADDGRTGAAVLNVLLSLALGLAAVAVGRALA